MIAQERMWLADLGAYGEIRDRCLAEELPRSPTRRGCAACGAVLPKCAPAVTDKQFTCHSPTRDPHDYVSIGTYWWPSPESSDGLPYVSRDGQLSPDFHLYDAALG